jgi:cobaltochelatase CobS
MPAQLARLHTGAAKAMIAPLHDAALHTTNANRTTLRKLLRQIITDHVGRDTRDAFRNSFGIWPSQQVDKLSMGALVDLTLGFVLTSLRGDDGFALDAWDRLVAAMTHEHLCHPKKRGAGVSVGYNLDCIEGQAAAAELEREASRHGIALGTPPTPTATATSTSTSTATTGTVTMTKFATLTAESAIGVLAACCDILGMDAIDASLDAMVKQGFDCDDMESIKASVRDMNADSNLTSIDDLSDDLAEHVQSITLALRAASRPASAPTTAPKADAPTLDPNLVPAVDALLKQATGGALSSIGGLIAKHGESLSEIASLTETIERLKASASVAPVIAKSGKVVVDRASLTYEVVMRKASEVFVGPLGQQSPTLDFEIVTLVWRDDNGNVVSHPDCPDVEPAYQFRLRHLLKFLSAFKFGQNAWLHGHTGTGKTTLAEQIAARIGFPIERLNLDSNLERADIVGATEIVIESGAPVTKFREGILPRAMQQPCMFVLDEIDAGRPDVLFVIQRALERKGLTLTEDGGRTVQPHELFRFVATANSRGQGDEHGWYQGVRPMNLAMLNRFGAFIHVDYLDKDDEERLLSQTYAALTPSEVMELAQFSVEVRTAFKSGEISQTVSPRGLHAMAEYYLHFKQVMQPKLAMREAVETVVIDAAPADCEQRIRELADRVFA